MIYTPSATVTAPFTATFTYQASDAKNAISEPTPVSVAVTGAAVNEDMVVTSYSVTVRSNNRYTWDLAGTESRGTGERWRVSVSTTGAGPTPSPIATIRSMFGQAVTVPIAAH
mgnify:CR=1 FL=1